MILSIVYEDLEGSLWCHGKVYVTNTSKFRMIIIL